MTGGAGLVVEVGTGADTEVTLDAGAEGLGADADAGADAGAAGVGVDVDEGAGVGVCVGVEIGAGVGNRVAVGVDVGAGLDEGGGDTAAGVVPLSISRWSTGADRLGAPSKSGGDATVLAAAGLTCSAGVALTLDAVFTAGGWDKATLAGYVCTPSAGLTKPPSAGSCRAGPLAASLA